MARLLLPGLRVSPEISAYVRVSALTSFYVPFAQLTLGGKTSVSATLERQGLIWNDPPGFVAWGITDYGWRILNLLRNTNVAP